MGVLEHFRQPPMMLFNYLKQRKATQTIDSEVTAGFI